MSEEEIAAQRKEFLLVCENQELSERLDNVLATLDNVLFHYTDINHTDRACRKALANDVEIKKAWDIKRSTTWEWMEAQFRYEGLCDE